MAQTFVGIGGAVRALKGCYVGIGGVPRTVKEIYVGVGGVPRLTWTFGINRLYFTNRTGVGECDVATFAVIKAADSVIGYQIGSLGGIKRRLWAFDNFSAPGTSKGTSRIMELDKESRVVIRSQPVGDVVFTSWTILSGTANRLYKARNLHIQGSPLEIDPETYATIRSSPIVEYGDGGNGIAGTASRLLTFSIYGSSGRDIMHERDPATLGVIRSLPSLPHCASYTGIDKQIFSSEPVGKGYSKISQMDIETLAIVQSSPSIFCYYIGGTKG